MYKAFLVLLCLLLLSACGNAAPAPTPTPDPHAGEVLVADGMGSKMWVKLHETLPAMSLQATDFSADGSYINYTGSDAEALRGIDVSEHQQEIDWAAVAADGVEFAVIRMGYRGYSEGKLFEDLYFRQNVEGALENGLRVGVYFFSQATTPNEAREEAHFLLDAIAAYPVTLPVFYDWENIHIEPARTDGMSGKAITDCALAFTDEVKAAGYAAGVYFYRELGYRRYELDRLAGLQFWAGAAGETPDFYYEHALWQYSFTGKVAGIEGDCDLNLYFSYPEAAPEPEDDAAASANAA